jgi:hypothetical protein
LNSWCSALAVLVLTVLYQCLMYLGRANGTTMFYDVRSHESLRLPSDSIIVALRFTFFAPKSCRR